MIGHIIYRFMPLSIAELNAKVLKIVMEKSERDFLKQVGERVRIRRNHLHYSQSELAELANSDQRVISKLEAGLSDVRTTTLRRIARALQVDVDWLVRNETVGELLLGTPEPKKARSKRDAPKEPAHI